MASLTSAASWPLGLPFYTVVAIGVLYAQGRTRRPASPRHGGLGPRGRAAAFYGGLLSVVVALDSPLDPLSEKLFAAHMAQHVLLLTVAPPLIVLSAPWTQIWRPLPLRLRRSVAKALVRHPRTRPLRAGARAVTRPLVALLLFDANLVVWHVPALYDATLASQGIHVLEHVLFLTSGLLLWAQVLDSSPFRSRLDWLRRAVFMTVAMLVGWVLAIVIAFAPSPLYSAYASLPSRPGGLSALGDQQLAAGVMWVPGSLAYTIAIIVFFYRWLGPEPSARRTRLGVAGAG